MYVCIYARTYIHEHILAFGLLRIFAGEEKGAGRIKTLRTCGQPRDLGVCFFFVVIYDNVCMSYVTSSYDICHIICYVVIYLGVCYVVIYDRHVIDIMTFVVLSARCASNVMLQCMHVICHIIL